MDEQGYFSNGKEWSRQKEKALKELGSVSSYVEAHPIIEESLKVAGGKHSFLLTSEEKRDTYAEDTMPEIDRNKNILNIHLPPIMNAEENGKQYAEIVLEGIKNNQDANGMIIDLEDNTGGDMGPMITALSPLLPDGEILYFEHRQYDQPVILEEGEVTGGGTTVSTDLQPFKLDIPVAILTNENTASSAEAVVMSFLDLKQVKSFGQATAGYASANASYPLYDEAIMYLTVAYNKTPMGKIFYNDSIPVDVKTQRPLEEAMVWINSL